MNVEDMLMEYRIEEIRLLVTDSPILDIGCGEGRLLEGMRDWISKTGIDIDAKRIERAKERCPTITFHACDFSEWETDVRYKTIISTDVIEHVDNPMAFLKRCHELLKKRGKLILTTPNALALHKLVGEHVGYPLFGLTDDDRRKGHKHVFSSSILETLMRQAGFEGIETSGILLKPLPDSMMSEFSGKLIDAFYEVGKAFPALCSNLLMTGVKP